MISKLKYTLLAMMLAAFVAQPALASTLNNDDMAFAFGDSPAVSSDLGEMALLSDQEMKDTEGEWVWFAARLAYTGYKVWRATRRGATIYNRGWHKPHHNFGTRSRPSWRKHYQWNTSAGTYRVPYGRSYLYKNRTDLGYRSWWRR